MPKGGIMNHQIPQPARRAVDRLTPTFGANLSPAMGGLLTGLLYIIVSAAMIESNKWLMLEGNYPYPTALCVFHMLTSSVLSFALWVIAPGFFTGMAKLRIDRAFLGKFLPIGIAYSGTLVLSNLAYKYCSVAFIQMVKEGNIVLIYLASMLLGLECFSKTGAFLLLLVSVGAGTAVYGEINFSVFGLFVQMSSQIFEVMKILTQTILMSAKGHRLDPLSMVLFMSPISLMMISIFFLACHYDQLDQVRHDTIRMWPFLALSSLVAFSLNVVVAMAIWMFSSVGYMLAGVTKDIAIVVSSAIIFQDAITGTQGRGFSLALIGVVAYSSYKMNIDCFQEDSILKGFRRLFVKLTDPEAFANEKARLADETSRLHSKEPAQSEEDGLDSRVTA